MTVEYIRYRIDEARQAAFIADYRAAAESLDDSEYCLGYEMTHCEEEQDRFILRILWTSTGDHLGGFRSSAAFRSFFGHIRPYVGDIEEMQHYEVVGGLSSDGSAASRRST
jgi:quinol monooxygenase YgiN